MKILCIESGAAHDSNKIGIIYWTGFFLYIYYKVPIFQRATIVCGSDIIENKKKQNKAKFRFLVDI